MTKFKLDAPDFHAWRKKPENRSKIASVQPREEQHLGKLPEGTEIQTIPMRAYKEDVVRQASYTLRQATKDAIARTLKFVSGFKGFAHGGAVDTSLKMRPFSGIPQGEHATLRGTVNMNKFSVMQGTPTGGQVTIEVTNDQQARRSFLEQFSQVKP